MCIQKNREKTILILVPYYFPGYKAGGPIRSIVNLVEWLGEELDIKIITTDRDLMDRTKYPGIDSANWTPVCGAEVLYLPPSLGSFFKMIYLLIRLKYDVIYLNCFFSLYYSILPSILLSTINLNKSRIILAPRGCFSSEAMSKKNNKKKLFVFLFALLRINKIMHWHATSVEESKDINTIFNNNPVSVIPNMPPKQNNIVFQNKIKHPGTLSIVFLSLISPIKNLLLIIDALRNVQDEIQFSIYGPIMDKQYWDTCCKEIELLQKNIKVEYKGVVPHKDVIHVISQYDLFVLPSKSENYGHVILESLLALTPVLISDRTPWLHLEENGLGWDVPLEDPIMFKDIILLCSKWDSDELNSYRRNIFNWITIERDNISLKGKYLQMFYGDSGEK